jgi:hypothetical protein
VGFTLEDKLDKELIVVLNDISKKLERHYKGRKLEKYRKQLSNVASIYENLEIGEDFTSLYNSLVNRGKELKSDLNLRDRNKLEFYIRYVNAAVYDFTNNIKPLNTVLKSFLLTATLFFVLSPQYFSYVLPIVFILPTFLGVRGMKKRTFGGLVIGALLLPMSLMVSVVWLKNATLVYTGTGIDAYIAQLASSYGIESLEFAKNMFNAMIMLSLVMFGSSIYSMYTMFKYRKMFI